RSTDCGESVERGRCCHCRANGNVLQGNAYGRKKACRCTENRTSSHVADKPMVITVLLGCLYAAGRMEVSEVGSDAVWNTPKAFANFSPGLERSDNPGKRE